jgi:hypothetical protein
MTASRMENIRIFIQVPRMKVGSLIISIITSPLYKLLQGQTTRKVGI